MVSATHLFACYIHFHIVSIPRSNCMSKVSASYVVLLQVWQSIGIGQFGKLQAIDRPIIEGQLADAFVLQ